MTVKQQNDRDLFASAGRVGKLGEVRPPLAVHAVHAVLVVCGRETAVLTLFVWATLSLVYRVLTST